MAKTSTCGFQKYPDALAPRLEYSDVNLGGLAPRHPDTFENRKYSTFTRRRGMLSHKTRITSRVNLN